MQELLSHLAEAKTPLALAAFAIAAIGAAYNAFLGHPSASTRKALWGVIVVMGLIGVIALVAIAPLAIYRVRVTAVDSNNVPIAGPTVRVTAANEAKTAPDGSCELAVPKASLAQDGKVTIFADKDAEYLHGNAKLTLGSDPNPSVIIELKQDNTAEISGMVEDDGRHALRDARVSVPGVAAVTTGGDGFFKLHANAARGEQTLIHAEKAGYAPVDQYHPVGDGPATIVLPRDQRARRTK